ncbi:MAG: glycosyltransferase [Chitinivibrionales bacterium]|nr:glycosyltransferase [Chitinivibrionales bacterium]MBD3394121.1 glycosyltransferase [Chitinivibrionales bacterium]
MARVDMHVHSRFSTHPSTWFLQRLGTRESYVDPELIYTKALQEGMDFVTVTDHNCIDGSLLLEEKYPDRVFCGLEATTYFPEDGTKIHVLVWGLDRSQFEEIEKRRENIYHLRSYILEEGLAHAVAHATFSLNRVITLEHVERLLLLFDYFEGINGSRNRSSNEVLLRTLSALTPRHIEELSRKHGIEPCGPDSWKKGVVGGSDDHSGLFIGKTHTSASAATPEEFIAELKMKRTAPAGRHNDYQGLALAIYKVAYDFSKSRSRGLATTFFSALNTLIFEQEAMGIKKRLVLEKLRLSKTSLGEDVKRNLQELVDGFKANGSMCIEDKLVMLDDKITAISDAFFKNVFERVAQSVKEGDVVGFIRSVSSSLPGVFLSIPFFTTLNLLNESRRLNDQLARKYASGRHAQKRRVLWFTDTLTDLNGVSATLVKLGMLAHERDLDLKLVACLTDDEKRAQLPPNVLRLPCILTYTPSYFKTYTLRFPSVLASLKAIYKAEPDVIYISTPGPVGMLGLLVSKLLHVPSVAIYHTDFTRQARQIIGDDFICRTVEDFTAWFYSFMDSIRVPTQEYISILEKRGFDARKMVRFKRGIDARVFSPRGASGGLLKKNYGIEDGPTLVHSGRVSKEKNVDFLAEVYRRIAEKHPETNLVFAGDGPYLEEFSGKMREFPRVHFIGRVARESLPSIYSASSALLFPSVTDTFGMVVLEAQACGLPAIVSDFGGPKEIVVNGRTGFVARADDIDEWVAKAEGIIAMTTRFPALYAEMRENARRHVVSTYDWDSVLHDIFAGAPVKSRGDHPGDLRPWNNAVPAGFPLA